MMIIITMIIIIIIIDWKTLAALGREPLGKDEMAGFISLV